MLFPSPVDCDWLRLAGQKAFDFRNAGTALRAAPKLLFQPTETQPASDTGAHRALADVFAVTQNLAAGRGTAWWCTERREQPAA